MSAIPAALLTIELATARDFAGVSPTADVIRTQLVRAKQHFSSVTTRASVAQRFAELAATWQEEKGYSSSVQELVLCPSYQRIISLGRQAVPCILLELARRPDHWFWALTSITGINPVPDGAAGNLAEMTEAWIRWGEREGYLD